MTDIPANASGAEQGHTEKLFFLDQHGCAKNQVDGELLIRELSDSGWSRTSDPGKASVIIVNSCGFIEDAKKESLQAVIAAKRDYPGAKVILAGCLAERYAEELKDGLPEADGIFGNGDLSLFPGVAASAVSGERPVVRPPQNGVCDGGRREFLSFPRSAYVKITEGCDNCCSFCAIPLIRGNLRSRSAGAVCAEIAELAGRGIYEINLIGQDLASWGLGAGDGVRPEGKSPLSVLLERISLIPGDFRVRLLYIHPDHFPLDILPVIWREKRILPYFDIPFQHGDAGVIRAMNRRGTPDQYISLVKEIRAQLPDAVLRTTFLTGFPGETDEAFRRTAEFLKAIRPDWSGTFMYSREDGTPAASMKGHVPKKKAAERKAELERIQRGITADSLNMRRGHIYDVLIEEIIEGGEGFALGRCWFQAPEVDGAVVVRYDCDNASERERVKPGALVSVKILAVAGVDLDGILV